MDYLFVTDKGVFSRSDAGADADLLTTLKVLVIYDSFSKAICAIAVPRKGADEFVVKTVVATIVWLGHSRVTVRADNEKAIVAMIGEALKGLKVNLIDAAAEGSVPYDPQTNGAAESAVRLAKGMLIVHRRGLERRIQAKIPPTHPLMTWLVAHAVMLRTLCVRGDDGHTPYERLRGSPFRNEMYGFGEFVRFKCRSHKPHIPGTEDRWSKGIWLGFDLKTGQNVVYDCGEGGEQIRHARTVMRLPDPQKWDSDRLSSIKITPWSNFKADDPESRFREYDRVDKPAPEDSITKARRIYIRQKDLDDFGYTAGCKRCDHIIAYGSASANKTSINHSDACRARLMGEIEKTPAGRARIANMTERENQFFEKSHLAQGEKDANVDDGRGPPSSFQPFGAPAVETPVVAPPVEAPVEAAPASASWESAPAAPSLLPMPAPPGVPFVADNPGMDVDVVLDSTSSLKKRQARRARAIDCVGRVSGDESGVCGSGSAHECDGPNPVRSDERSMAPAVDATPAVVSHRNPSQHVPYDANGNLGCYRPVLADQFYNIDTLSSLNSVFRYPRMFDGFTATATTMGEHRTMGEHQRDPDLDTDMRDLARIFIVEARDEARQHHAEAASIIALLGGDGRKYIRERARAARAIVSELYSPPRVSAMAGKMPSYGIEPGLALDLTVSDENGIPWDFSIKAMRDKAEALLEAQKPLFLIGSPMCTAFSAWQFINNRKRDPATVEKEKAAGVMHLEWCCKMYAKQLDRGAYFLHEHPAGATSWKQDCIQRLLARDGVDRVVADQCQHGQETEDGDPLKKPTGFLSNSAEILRVLERRCKGRKGLCSREAGGRHALCNGKVARRAAIFHAKMCEAILEGMRNQCVADGLLKIGEVGLGVHMLDGDDELAACNLLLEDKPDNARDNCKPAEHVITPDRRPFEDLDPSSKRSKIITSSEYGHSFAVSNGRNERFVDDLTGQPLPPDLCREARRVEIQYFRDKGVWDLKPIREALARTGRRPSR